MKKEFTILFLFVSIFSFAQKQGNMWCFADSCCIDFNSSNAVLNNNSVISYDGGQEEQASIADKNGNLLFYTDGETVWNKNSQVMINGSGLNGNDSYTQGVIILPKPEDSLTYFIFVNKGSGLFYNIVDMNLDSGKGGIVSGFKNVVILDTIFTEKQMAVKHANGRDWWLIVHGYNNQTFYKFLITPDTILLKDVQKIGTSDYMWGEMEISNNGEILASVGMYNPPYTKGYIDIFDFDRCSGMLSKWQQIGDTTISSYYGCSFSQSGKLLYVSTFETLFQYDCTVTDIKASKEYIWTNPYYNPNPVPHYRIGQHQLGPDGKIYINVFYAIAPNNVYSFQNQNLSVINSPDSVGAACDFLPFSFNLGCHRNEVGLPNIPNYYLGRLIGSPCDTLSGMQEITSNKIQITIYPNPANDEVTIAFTNETVDNTVFELYDMIGNKVFDKKIESHKKQENLTISQLQQGIYLYKLKENNKLLVTDKLIIIR